MYNHIYGYWDIKLMENYMHTHGICFCWLFMAYTVLSLPNISSNIGSIDIKYAVSYHSMKSDTLSVVLTEIASWCVGFLWS